MKAAATSGREVARVDHSEKFMTPRPFLTSWTIIDETTGIWLYQGHLVSFEWQL